MKFQNMYIYYIYQFSLVFIKMSNDFRYIFSFHKFKDILSNTEFIAPISPGPQCLPL